MQVMKLLIMQVGPPSPQHGASSGYEQRRRPQDVWGNFEYIGSWIDDTGLKVANNFLP
jgi:hypothetical protein